MQLSVRLLRGDASLGSPRAASLEVDLLDGGAFTQVGRAGGRDRQQQVLADLRVLPGRHFLQRADAGCQLGNQVIAPQTRTGRVDRTES